MTNPDLQASYTNEVFVNDEPPPPEESSFVFRQKSHTEEEARNGKPIIFVLNGNSDLKRGKPIINHWVRLVWRLQPTG